MVPRGLTKSRTCCIPELLPNRFGSLRFKRIVIRDNQRLTNISSTAFNTELTNYLEIRGNKDFDGNQVTKFVKIFNNLQEIHIINNNIEEIFDLNQWNESLETIDLSENKIITIKSNTFKTLKKN